MIEAAWIVGGPAVAYMIGYWLGYRYGQRDGRDHESLRNALRLSGQTEPKEVP